MTWVRLDDGFADHPKIAALSDRAFRVHVRGFCYANRYLTDGRIPLVVGRAWGASAVRELVASGLWIQDATGYMIHDFLDYQESRAEVEERRGHISNVRSKAGSKGAAKRWQTDGKRDGSLGPSTVDGKAMAPSHTPTPTVKPKSKRLAATSAATERRDEVFEAFCEIEGIDWRAMNDAERSRIAKAAQLARQNNATAEQVRLAAERWPDVMPPDATRTAMAVASRLSHLLNGQARGPRRVDNATRLAAKAVEASTTRALPAEGSA